MARISVKNNHVFLQILNENTVANLLHKNLSSTIIIVNFIVDLRYCAKLCLRLT